MFEPDNAKDLADKILELYKNEGLRQRFARTGQESVNARFTEEGHYKQLLAHFSQLIDH